MQKPEVARGVVTAREFEVVALQEVSDAILADMALNNVWRMSVSGRGGASDSKTLALVATTRLVEDSWQGKRTAAMRIEGGLVVVSVYMPVQSGCGSAEDIKIHLAEIVVAIKKLQKRASDPVVVMGDFNTTSEIWDRRKTSNNKSEVGEAIVECMIDLELSMKTTVDEPTWRWGSKESIIDLTFVSKQIEDAYICIDETAVLYDHMPITIIVHDSTPRVVPLQAPQDVGNGNRYDTRQVDWQEYRNTIDRRSKALIRTWQGDEDLDVRSGAIRKLMVHSTLVAGGRVATTIDHDTSPRKHKDGAGPPEVWYDNDCKIAHIAVVQAERSAEKEAMESPEVQLSEEPKEKRRQLDQIVRVEARVLEAKRNQRYVQSKARDDYINSTVNNLAVDHTQGWVNVNRLMNKKPVRSTIGRLVKEDGSRTQTMEETAELIAKTLFKDSRVMTSEQQGSLGRQRRARGFGRDITEVEVDEAIRQDGGNSPGLDGIPLQLIKEAWKTRSFKDILLSIYNQCYWEGNIPAEWKQAVITAALKAGKVAEEAKSYRPISLMSIVSKILERIIATRLQYFAIQKAVLSLCHQGGIIARSAEEALIKLVTAAKVVSGKCKAVMGVDVSGAFNNVDVETLEKILRSKLTGVLGEQEANFCTGWAQERDFKIKLDGIVIGVRNALLRGIPQGSPLGPILWAFYVDDLVRRLETLRFPGLKITVLSYVDDVNVVLEASTWTRIAKGALEVKAMMEEWARQRKIGLSKGTLMPVALTASTLQKAKAALAYVGRAGDEEGKVTIGVDEEIKILGLRMDSKMNFIPHIRTKVTTAIRQTWALRHLKLSPRTKMTIVKMIIWPAMEYGLSAALPMQEGATSLLDKADSVVLGWVLGINTIRDGKVGKEVAWMETGTFPASYRIWAHARKMVASRTDAQFCYASPTSHSLRWKENHSEGPMEIITRGIVEGNGREMVKPWEWRKETFVHTGIESSKEEAIQQHEELTKDFKGIVAYTDGSLTTKGSGSGAVILRPSGQAIEMYEPAFRRRGIFPSEMRALEMVLRHLKELTSTEVVRIFSDSQACLKSLMQVQRWITPGVRRWTVEAADEVQNRVELYWLPGHRDIAGNEWADKLAKRAAAEYIAPDDGIVTIIDDIDSTAKEALRQILAKYNKGDHTLTTTINFDYMMESKLQWSQPAHVLSRRVRWMTGHAYKRPLDGQINMICECEEDLKPKPELHILFDCPTLTQARLQFDIMRSDKDTDMASEGWIRNRKGLDDFLQRCEQVKAESTTAQQFLNTIARQLDQERIEQDYAGDDSENPIIIK